MEDGVRSRGVLKKKSSSGCLIIKKKDDRMGMIGGHGSSGVSQKVKKRPRMVVDDLETESSEELSEPIARRGAQKFRNGSVGCVKSGVEDREFDRSGQIESERKRSRLDLFDFDEYDEFDMNKGWHGYGDDRLKRVARTGSSGEFASGSSRNLMVEKRKHSYMDSSSSLSGSRTIGDDYGVKKKYDMDEDDTHMPISKLRLKYQEESLEPIRLQGKNGVLKVMVSKKKKKIDLAQNNYDPRDFESSKGSRSENVVKTDLVARPFYSDSKRPEKRPLSIKKEKTELKSQKAFLTKGIKSVDSETDGTDTSLKLAPPSSQPASSKMRAIKEESTSLAAGDVTPAKSKEGKLKRGGSTEKQQLRERIRGMLIETGWTIDYRPRKNRDYLDAVYINPSGTAYWSIIKAYDALQKQLEEDSGLPKPDGGSCSFAPLSDDLINKLTRQTRKKIEKEMKRKRKDDAKNRDHKKSSKRESVGVTESDQHEEKLSSYINKRSKLLKGKLRATDLESDDDSSDNSLKGGRPKQDMVGKSSCGAASNAIHERKSRIIGRCTLLVRRSDKGQDCESDDYVPYTGKRTLLAWMIDSGIVKLSQKVQYMNRRRTRVMLEGWITRDGIHCGCCSKILPVSKFELHAGSKLRQPFQNIILESGVSLLECLVDAWNRQEESERQGFYTVDIDGDDPDDDTCGICGDGGDLICCDGCPSTFHQSCLGIQMLPPGDWHCPNCTCKICGTASSTAEDSGIDVLLHCSLCERKYHKSCSLEVNALSATSNNPSASFCGQKCQELYDHLQKILGVKHEIEGGFSWSIIQRTDLDSDRSHRAFPQRVECNSKLAVALDVMDECFLPIMDRKSGIHIIHNVLYNCGSNFSRLNFRGFYTAILERGDEIISAASIRIRGTQLAEMPFIGTRNIYRRQGMCRRLLSAIETVLSTLKVEKLIIPAISEHMHTWTVVFGFNPLEESHKLEMKSINMLVFPGTDMLQKRLLKQEIPEGDMNAGESKLSHPQLPALVEKADQDSLTRGDENLHDEACVERVDGAENPGSPASPVDLSESTMVRAQDAYCGSDIQTSSNEGTPSESVVEKKLREATTELMPSSPSGASNGKLDFGAAALDPSPKVDTQSSDQDFPIRGDGNLHDEACLGEIDGAVGGKSSGSPASPVGLSESTMVRAQGAHCGSDIQISSKEGTPTPSESMVEKKLPESITNLMPSSPSGASSDKLELGAAALGPSPQVEIQSCEPVDQKVCKEDAQPPCSGVSRDSLDEASTRKTLADKENVEVSDNASSDTDKFYLADSVDSCFPDSGAPGAGEDVDKKQVSEIISAPCVSGRPAIQLHSNSSQPSRPDVQNGLDVSSKQTSDVKHLSDANASQNEGNVDSSAVGDGGDGNIAEVSSSGLASDSSSETFLDNDALEKNINYQLGVSSGSQVCVSNLNPSDDGSEAKVAIQLHSDSTQPSRPDVQNGLHVASKQTSDVKHLSDANASQNEGNVESSAVGDSTNIAEVSSSGLASDSSSETFLDNAALEKNTNYQLDISFGSQVCGSNLNPSCDGSEAKVALAERIVHSEPRQPEGHDVNVIDICSGTVTSSADVSVQLDAEDKD